MSDRRKSASFALSPKKLPFSIPHAMTNITPSSRRQSLNLQHTPTRLTEEINNEAERRERQLNRLQHLNNRATASPPITPTDRRRSINSTLTSGLTNQQLTDHYATCIKLSAENKINVKNAFNLQLIDYMTVILKRKDSDMNSFQVASCTLDASTKIYAYRVDSVHTDTLKMAGGLGRTKDRLEDEGGLPGDPKGRKRNKTKKTTTIVTNTKSINVPHFDLEFDVDPLFKKTAAQFDEGRCGGGQFLSSLQLLDDTTQLILDSDTMITDLIGDNRSTVQSDIASIPPFPDLEKPICATFTDFNFTSWKLSDEDTASSSETPEFDQDEEHAFDINAIPEPVEMDVPEVGGFDGGMDYGDDNDGTAVTVEGLACGPKMPAPQLEVIHLKEHLASGRLEYSYFDNKCMSAWAGPGHWKFKPLLKNRVSSIAKGDRRKTIIDKMDYKENPEDLEEKFEVKRKATKLTKNTVKNWSFNNTTLPVDLHYDPKQFGKMYLRPGIVIRRHPTEQSATEVDDNVQEYDYDNQNDQENFCADVGEGSNDGDNERSGFFSQTLLPSQDPNAEEDKTKDFLGDNLVEAPNKVAQINIGYARTAKKIDMKKLKSTMWFMLTDEDINKENKRNGANTSLRERMIVEKEQSFAQLYRDMGPKLPAKMAENISVPLAFIALLHLANEHSLKMISISNDLGDFIIDQD